MAKSSKKPFPVVHFEIQGRSLDRSAKFYAKLFNWKIQQIPEMGYGMAEAGGNKKGAINGGLAAASGGKPFATFYVQVPSVKKAFAEAKKLGGKVLSGPDKLEGMGMTIGMLADADGVKIGVLQED